MWWGLEAQCSQCFGWWPIETEFFPLIVNGRAQGACKACRLESEQRRRGRGAYRGHPKPVSTELRT
jgi:hypothetical protein